MLVKTHAKINLYLKVFPLRPDGYHDIISVMQTIDLTDEMTLMRKGDNLQIECAHKGVPTDDTNTIAKVYKALAEEYPDRVTGVVVKLNKQIPLKAGLAGGSGNAAGALIAFCKLFEIPLESQDLVNLSMRVGSDIPFMLKGGCALVSGRGEIVDRLPAGASGFFLLITSGSGVDTGNAYRLLDESRAASTHKFGKPGDVFNEIRSAWLSAIASDEYDILLHNDFEEAVFEAYPELAQVKENLRKIGLPSYLTGSGSALYAPVRDFNKALELLETVRGMYGDGVYLCQPIERGVEIYD